MSSPISTDLPLSTDILRDYTLEFEIRVERALVDLRECLREAVRDRDCYREIADTLMEDIEEVSRVQKSKLTTLRAELDWRRHRGSVCPIEILSHKFGGQASGFYSKIFRSRSHLG